ncbi:MAG: AraC family transcriptional regulator [Sneathiellaceae bacterium]
MELIDTGIRSAAAAIALLTIVLLLRDSGRSLAAWLGAAFALGVVAYLVCAAPPFRAATGWWRLPVVIGCIANPALFWLFARSLFDDAMRLSPWDALPLLLLEALALSRIAGALDIVPQAHALAGAAGKVLAIALVLHALFVAWTGRRGDLLPARRRFRLVFAAGVGGYILLVLATELSVGEAAVPAPWSLAGATAILALVAALALYLARLRRSLLPAPAGLAAAGPHGIEAAAAQNRPPSQQHDTDPALLGRLRQLMEVEEAWRQEGLTIAALAELAAVPEYRLRRAINSELGYRNFPAYLNDCRIAAARRALADPALAALPVLTVALDLGYGSIGPFNRAFKERTGQTPSAFRQAALRNGPGSQAAGNPTAS